MTWYEVYDAIFKTNLSANEKLVLLTFYRWTDGGIKSCWHGLKVISKTTSLSVRTCRNTINSLHSKGLLSVEHRLATSNLYDVSVENLQNYKSMTTGKNCTNAKINPRQDLPHPQAGFAAHPRQDLPPNVRNYECEKTNVGKDYMCSPKSSHDVDDFCPTQEQDDFVHPPILDPTFLNKNDVYPHSIARHSEPGEGLSSPALRLESKTSKKTKEEVMSQEEQDKRKSYINAVNDKWKTYKPAVKPIKFTSDVARSICARIEENSLDEFLLTIDWLFQDKHKKSRATYLRENKYDSLETLSRQTKFASYLNFALEWKSEGGEQSSQNGAESTGDHFLDMLYGKGKYAKQSYINAEFETKEPSLFPIGGNNGK